MRRKKLSEILYYLGISLKKLGLCGSAIKSWNTGKKIYRNGLSSMMYVRYSNGYGMVRQASSELDDWNAFYSVQLRKYLNMKRSRKIGTEGERDMIWDLLFDHWVIMLQSGCLDHKTESEKYHIFQSEEVVFPSFRLPERIENRLLAIDFQKKVQIGMEDPCPCHSGLPYIMCCGRIHCEEELFSGIF